MGGTMRSLVLLDSHPAGVDDAHDESSVR
jgi:hypothetical protein